MKRPRHARAEGHEELIVTHKMADLDALASAVAAQKLHPRAAILLDAGGDRDVHAYLALHRERFQTVRQDRVDLAAVRRVILVDVRRKSRLGAIAALLERIDAGDATLEVHVYDHHASALEDVRADFALVEALGSATTLLVERIRALGLDVDAVEATLFMLGIHADTRSLTAASTTARDAHAVAWLLERGARLDVVSRYVQRRLGPEQRRILERLLGACAADLVEVQGLTLGVATVALEAAPSGLADVTSAAADVLPLDALVALYVIAGRRVHVVARARSPLFDVGRALEAVGGGGHAAAASANVRHADVAAIRAAITDALRAHTPAPPRVRDAMSSPVHTVGPTAPLREVAAALERLGHHGAPVLDADERLVGVVTLTDVDAAERRGQLDFPTASCMSQHRLHTITAAESLEAALELMTTHDVGRLPVVEAGRVVGIVTRSDALAFLYARPRRRDAAPP
jgi:tRNA nucleotidyltransferase (CCA-adding enzyme)